MADIISVAAQRITDSQIRHNDHVTEYEAIFGSGSVWCRALPWM